MDLDLRGKHALVTGGSRGIGRAIVLALVRQGVSVAAGYRNDSDQVAGLQAELTALGNGSHVVRADVADESDVVQMVEAVRARFGQIDILVNNAGIVSTRTIDELDLAEWRRVIDTNLTSTYLIIRAALAAIPRGGSIVNVTSAVAMRGMSARAHYTASKAGLIGLTRSLCKELGERGIRVNAIAPGIVETDQAAGLSAAGRSRYSGMIALGRLGTPEEIAGAALFLASELSAYVSGEVLTVDGGI